MKFYKDTERGQEAVSEVTKEWFNEGAAAEHVNTEREKARADSAEKRADEEHKRADEAEKEIKRLKELLLEHNLEF